MNRLLLKAALVMGLMTLFTQVATMMYLDNVAADDVLAMLAGPSTLVADSIANTPPPQRRDEGERLAERLGYPINFQDLLRPGAPRTEWRGGGLVVIAPIPDDSGEVILGPLPYDQEASQYIGWVILVPLVLAILLALGATYPMVRDIRKLEDASRRMQRGDFGVRYQSEEGDALSEVGASLNDLADRIGQLLSDERDLMRTVAHEVRAPIARMRFRVEMLQSAVSEEDNRHATGLVGDLAQVDGLFEELLTYVAFDEFDQERPELTTTRFNMGEAVRSVVDEIADVPADRTITVEGDADVSVVANRKLFDRAVANLVRNAVAYSDSQVRVVLRSYARECVVDVQDDGPGIPENDRPKVIKPFVRLDTSGKKPRGTGLGLAIVSRIMRLHRGRLHIVDAPRGGASCQLVWANDRVGKVL